MIKDDFIGSVFTINKEKIKDHKENYFRFYIDGDKKNYIGIFFDDRGNVISGDLYSTMVDYKGDEYIDCARFIGEKKTIMDFLGYVHKVLKQKSCHKHENENRLFNLLCLKFR